MGQTARIPPRRRAAPAAGAIAALVALAGCQANPHYDPVSLGDVGDAVLGLGAVFGMAATFAGLQEAGGGEGSRYLFSQEHEWERDRW
ncbi:MAG: hypothetical protein IT431_07575 [Phycisphaerales bacterium]|nr:hypothetical protein [Phycisphaerales bacterium]